MTGKATPSSTPKRPGNRGAKKNATSSGTRKPAAAGGSASRVLRKNTSAARTVTSTAAKNAFRQLIQKAKSGPVFVTSHRRREAVVLSVEDYEQLLANQRDPLADMEAYFDALVAKMQTPANRTAVDALFDATPEELGEDAMQGAKGD